MEDSKSKLDEIVTMLVAAGYFRARISTLSPFDKVVGGLAWCISCSNISVDLGLDISFFRENSSIGQKIKIGEGITAALKRMKCPFPLQSHQIRGLDYPSIFPVVQWLVKTVIETRSEREASLRSLAEMQFRQHHTSTNNPAELLDGASRGYIKSLLQTYGPRRKFRQTAAAVSAEPVPETKRVRRTLMEYGQDVALGASAAVGTASEGKKKFAAAREMEERLAASKQKQAAEKAEQPHEAEDHDDRMLLTSFDAKREGRVAASTLEKVFAAGGDADDIRAAAAAYASEAQRRQQEDDPFVRSLQNLQQELTEAQARLKEMQTQGDSGRASAREAEGVLAAAVEATERATNEIRNYEASLAALDPKDVQAARNLLETNERLRRQREELQQNCIAELARWKAKIEEASKELEASGLVVAAGGTETDHQQAANASADTQRLERLRAEVADKNKQISLLGRRIEAVPTRGELMQYERRFIELYDQVTATLEETRRYYNVYNTLEESRMYLAKELSLLESIAKTFESISSKEAKGKFLDQLSTIIDGVLANKTRTDKKVEEEQTGRRLLEAKLQEIQENQRKYFLVIKDFQDEAHRNDVLLSKLHERNAV